MVQHNQPKTPGGGQAAEGLRAQEHRFEVALGWILRGGALFASLVVAVGGAIYLARHGAQVRDYSTFTGEPEGFTSLQGIFGQVAALRGQGIIQLGLVALIATPILRVVFSIFMFSRQRDWFYVGVTLIVLAVLSYGMTGALL